jgi:hypothetical protein
VSLYEKGFGAAAVEKIALYAAKKKFVETKIILQLNNKLQPHPKPATKVSNNNMKEE